MSLCSAKRSTALRRARRGSRIQIVLIGIAVLAGTMMLYFQRCMFWIFTIMSSLLWGSMIGVLLKGVTHDLIWCVFFGVVVGVISFVFHMAARLRYYG